MIALLFLENVLKAATKNTARKHPVDSIENCTPETNRRIPPLTSTCKKDSSKPGSPTTPDKSLLF